MGNIFSNENEEDHEEEIEELHDNEDDNSNSLFGGWFETKEEPTHNHPTTQKKKTKNVKFDDKFTFDDEGLRKQHQQKTRKRKTGQKNKTKGRRY